MSAHDRSPVPLLPLVRAAVAGDTAALERLLVETFTPTRRFLERRYGGRREAAAFIDDVMQETLIRVADHLTECSAAGEPGVRNWVLSIADNAARDELRRGAVRITSRTVEMDLEAAGARQALHAWQNAMAEESDDRDDKVDRALRTLACRAQDELPELTVAIIWHRLAEGAPWECVAAELRAREPNLTAKAVKNRYQRALARLARIVRECVATLPAPEREALEAWLAQFSRRRRDRPGSKG